jgi:copper chaperone
MTRTTLDVDGMACGGCEANVTDHLEALDGIDAVSADHEAGEVRVEHDAETGADSIRDAVEEAGYEVVV